MKELTFLNLPFIIKIESSDDMKQKGFAISGILYSVLILFLALLVGIMTTLAKQKILLDKIKLEVNQRLNQIKEAPEPVPTPKPEYFCEAGEATDLENLSYGNSFTCELGDGESRTFYFLEEKDGNIYLILNQNLGDNVAWISKEDYISAGGTEANYGTHGNSDLGPITVEAQLKNQTRNWVYLTEEQILLPTGTQLSVAGGDTAWNIDNYTAEVLSSWLFENLDGTTKQGYWTSDKQTANTNCGWALHYNGIMYGHYLNDATPYGVRPVIKISRDVIH